MVGHSMGGRTAVATADEPNVRGVVVLAPWLPEGEPVEPLAGRVFAAAHGRRDRITSADRTREFTERARAVTLAAEFRDMGPIGHYLLRRIAEWNRFAVDHATRILD
jgi:pimeloyl-ACP methyl ester carboxylesterase